MPMASSAPNKEEHASTNAFNAHRSYSYGIGPPLVSSMIQPPSEPPERADFLENPFEVAWPLMDLPPYTERAENDRQKSSTTLSDPRLTAQSRNTTNAIDGANTQPEMKHPANIRMRHYPSSSTAPFSIGNPYNSNFPQFNEESRENVPAPAVTRPLSSQIGRKVPRKPPIVKSRLEGSFQDQQFPNKEEKRSLAQETGLSEEQVDNWFKKRRQLAKKTASQQSLFGDGSPYTSESNHSF